MNILLKVIDKLEAWMFSHMASMLVIAKVAKKAKKQPKTKKEKQELDIYNGKILFFPAFLLYICMNRFQ